MSTTLIIAPPPHWQNHADLPVASTLAEGRLRLKDESIRGVVLFTDGLNAEEILLTVIEIKSQPCRWILVNDKIEDPSLWRLINLKTPFRVVSGFDKESLQAGIDALIERLLLDDQEDQRRQLVQEKTAQLKVLNRDLESRVDRRQKTLVKAKDKLDIANRQIETLHAATLAIHRARSVAELENLLATAMGAYFHIDQVRIRFHSQSSLAVRVDKAIVEPLLINEQTIGELVLIRGKSVPVDEASLDLIHQIADAVALGVDRLGKLEQAEVLKQQWQATFDAIDEPLCLTDREFRILRTNRSFAMTTGLDFRNLLNKNCFEIFFGEAVARNLAKQGPSFKTRQTRGPVEQLQTFDIFVQPLKFESLEGEVSLVLLRNITQRQHIERQLLESSKMAELGLIGSSIAHELNNPLGGMLSFIQLIRMDLKGNEPYGDDIREMEQAGRRCSEIVQDLLGFARKSDSSDRRIIDLREVIAQALKISELQTRSQGIVVKTDLPERPMPIEAQPNQLSQALCNLLQNSAEAILEKRRRDPRATGEITVALHSKEDLYELLIGDTGTGISPEVQDKIFNPLFTTKAANANSGLGLTMAYKIISEHSGHLELSSQPGVGTTAKIAFHRPDESPASPSF